MQYPGAFVTWKQASDPMQVPCSTSCSVNCVCRHFVHPRQCCFHGIPCALVPSFGGSFCTLTRLIIYVYAEAGIAIITASICLLFFLSAVPFFFLFPLSVLLLCRSCRCGNSLSKISIWLATNCTINGKAIRPKESLHWTSECNKRQWIAINFYEGKFFLCHDVFPIKQNERKTIS